MCVTVFIKIKQNLKNKFLLVKRKVQDQATRTQRRSRGKALLSLTSAPEGSVW
jgi:hypothetical protein